MSFKVRISEYNLANLQDLGSSIGPSITNLSNVTINNLQISTGAMLGYVLTCNNSGSAVWEPIKVVVQLAQ